MTILFLAAAAADIDACATAVHSDLLSAVAACDASGEKIELFGASGTTGACLDAYKAGQNAGKYGPSLPEPVREGLVREFDKKLQACKSPTEEPVVPEIPTVNLWN